MTRDQLVTLISLKEEFIESGRPNRSGLIIKPIKITIHNTSNKSAGANATLHSRFVRKTGYYIVRNPQTNAETKNWVSWHFTVDETIAIKQLPLNEKAYHAGTEANNTSIAIEICMHSGIDQEAANKKAAQLVALLCFDLSLPLAAVVTHNSWTGKNCPELLLNSWESFKEEINSHLQSLIKAEAVSFNIENFISYNYLISSEIPLCWTSETGVPELTKALSTLSLIQNGFNDKFLESGAVSLPVVEEDDPDQKDHVFIHHQNLSIYFNKTRKLALYTACNFNKDAFIEIDNRSNAFRDDNTIDSSFQLAEGFYGSKTIDKSKSENYFDRGHLIARRYNQWGATAEEAKKGEKDTYYYTTIHPQVGELNKREWEELESFIIESGKLDVRRVSIIAGALLKSNDPIAKYTDKFYNEDIRIQIPEVYWKVVFYELENELRKIAFLMSQRNRLGKLPMMEHQPIRETAGDDPFDKLGDPLKTYIVRSSLIESGTGLSFSPAKELYDKEEPLEIIIEDNDVESGLFESSYENISQFI
jgi:DNA/RNA endonuclease G (NUC1)